ncbi:MAG: uroporphyrinogen-III synthase [Pseudorhodobacter sp.]
MIPQSRYPVFLLTRPEPQGAAMAARLVDLFPDAAVVRSPLLTTDFRAPPLPEGPFSAVVFTSQAGVEAARRLTGLPQRAYCVGDRTAEAARKAGFVALSAGGAAEDLITIILETGEMGPLLHLRGAHSRGEIAARLAEAGVRAQALVIYEQRAQQLSGAAAGLLAGRNPVIAPLLSPRSARLFLREITRIGAVAPLFCPVLSPSIAAEIPETPDRRVFLATRPDLEALTKAIKSAYAVAVRS